LLPNDNNKLISGKYQTTVAGTNIT